MVKVNTQTHTTEKPSLLDQFKVSYEYDVSWSDAKRSIKTRTQR